MADENSKNVSTVPPGCELGDDYLSYMKKDIGSFAILSAVLAVLSAFVVFCVFIGFLPLDKTMTFCFVGLSFASALYFYYSLKGKEAGRLDKDGFHFDSQFFIFQANQDIPLDSILEFRPGKQSNQSNSETNLIEFVTSDNDLIILEVNSKDNYFREWLINSGNALLANLKKKAMDA